VLPLLQAAVRGYMSREHQMLTWHTLEGDLEAKQKALAETDKSKVRHTAALAAAAEGLAAAACWFELPLLYDGLLAHRMCACNGILDKTVFFDLLIAGVYELPHY
jgi:hypothetical protein